MLERVLKLRGQDFAALQWGTPGGVPIVMLHGFLDHAGAWERVAERLSGWRLALDQRGHGRSMHASARDDEAHATYHFAEYLADLDALVAQVGGEAILVGHSMGSTVASMYAGARPERVRGLVLVDGLGIPDSGDQGVERMAAFLDGVAQLPEAKRFASVEQAVARYRRSHPYVDADWAEALVARALRAAEGGWVWSWDARHRIRGPVPYRHAHHAQFLARIACPVLSVHPEQSPFAAADVARLEAAIPRLSVVEVPGCGHMVPLQAPAELAGAIARFLSEQVQSG